MPLDARCNSWLDILLAPVAIPPRRNSSPHSPLLHFPPAGIHTRWKSHTHAALASIAISAFTLHWTHWNSCPHDPLTPLQFRPTFFIAVPWNSRPRAMLMPFGNARFAPVGIRVRVPHRDLLQFPPACPAGARCNSCPHVALAAIGIQRDVLLAPLEFMP